MENLLDYAEPDIDVQFIDTQHHQTLDFETRWKNSISGDELVRRVHKHIDEWYATRRKQ